MTTNHEQWRWVNGHAGYEVSSLGRVRSYCRRQPKILTDCPAKSGYRRVSLGVGFTPTVHRIVALAFIPNPDGKPQVNHKNGNKCDNRAENLEWMTNSENHLHAYRNGICLPGRRKLNPEQVIEVRRSGHERVDVLAKRYGLTKGAIYHIRQGHTWSRIAA